MADLSRLRGDATLDTGATTTGVACLAAPASSPRADRPARYKAGAARRGRTYWVRGLHRAAHSGGQSRAVVTRECARLAGCVTPAATGRQTPANLTDVPGRDIQCRRCWRASCDLRPARAATGAQRTSSIGGAAPEGSLVRAGSENPGRSHQLVTARYARIRRASQPGEHEAKLVTMKFTGGNAVDYVQALKKAAGDINVIIAVEAKDVLMPPVELTDASVEAALEVLNGKTSQVNDRFIKLELHANHGGNPAEQIVYAVDAKVQGRPVDERIMQRVWSVRQ